MTGTTVKALAARLAAGEITAVELAEHAIARIVETNDRWHIFISWDPGQALQAARASDERRAKGTSLGRLDGIPFAIKDNLDAAGYVTTDGARSAALPADADSAAVARLRAAGAVLIGKLNMHEGALGATTDNGVWGRCENPALAGHTPGGSSGGSAAAITGGIVTMTLGTDTMGSVRIPAAYGGLWALKPTFGVVSRAGMTILSNTLDTIGPLANSAADLEATLEIIAGYDASDPDSVAPPDVWSTPVAPVDLHSLSFAVPTPIIRHICEPDIVAAFEGLLEAVQDAGARIVEADMAGWEPPTARRAGLLVLEAEGAGRLGDRLDHDDAIYSEEFRAMLAYGRDAPGVKIASAYRTIALCRSVALRTLSDVDAILMPAAPQAAFPYGVARQPFRLSRCGLPTPLRRRETHSLRTACRIAFLRPAYPRYL
jgi:aspartyl-tRNA(Asn)/glutamyl-tRNA(Gln) amidotransferase subunit A